MASQKDEDVNSSTTDTTIRTERPDFTRALMRPSGGVVHDERGNAQWQWSDSGVHRMVNLAPAALDVLDAPTTVETLPRSGPPAEGYDPYGQTLPGRVRRGGGTRTDLRELSRQILQARGVGKPKP